MHSLSTFERNKIIADIQKEIFDVVIIGGGITGAGIALDAALRGMHVCLLEKYDFASGTSSKSTKLIHGGLRYLKQMEFALVRKVGMERAVLHKLATHLVTPVNMLLPITKNGSLGKYTTSLALFMYDFLAKVKKQDQYKMLGPLQTLQLEPLLKKENVLGGALYKEYRTDDARLTIEIIKTAVEHNATCLNYVKAEEFIYDENKKINGVIFHDLIENKVYAIHAKKIINAAGPWMDEVRKIESEPHGKKLHLTKGIHIVINKNKLPVHNAIYFDVEQNKRMIFVIPKNEIIYIGTTDTSYNGDKDAIAVTKEDVAYLLNAVNKMFPSAKLKTADIQSSWAGLRPLIHEAAKTPSQLSRKDELFYSDAGLISIAGGKLTGYRKMAEKAVNIIAGQLQKNNKTFFTCKTSEIKLHGNIFNSPAHIEEYIERTAGEAKQINVPYTAIKYLVETYGGDTEIIIEKAFELYPVIGDARERILKAELLYCVENEMVTNISDFLIRRTGRLYFDKPALEKEYKMIIGLLSQILQLPENETENQNLFFEQILKQVVEFI